MRTRRFSTFAIFLAGFTSQLLLMPPTHAQEYRYAVFDLGDFGGDAANAFGINDDGTVVGCAWFPGNREFHPAVFAAGQSPVDLGTFGGPEGTCYEINNAGVVTGYAYDEYEHSQAFLFADQEMMKLGTLGGTSSSARSLNENNDVVGRSSTPGNALNHAFVWTNGVMDDLGSLGDDSGDSIAWDINEVGQTAGRSITVELNTAVLWQPDGEIIDLGRLPDGFISEAYAINDLGIIAGWSTNEARRTRSVIWKDGQIYNIGKGKARAINNSNEVVGYVEDPNAKGHGYVWEASEGMRVLDELIPPRIDMTIFTANDINAHGQIAAWGEKRVTHWYRALLLTPVDPELTLSDPVPGVAGEENTWTITGAQPGSKIVFAYSLKGGGTVVPGCDKLDAVLQINNPKIMKSAIADANGEATIQMYVPPAAKNAGDILFQAVSVKDCGESQLVVFGFQ